MKLSGICLETNNVPGLVDFYSKVFCSEAVGDSVHSTFEEAGLAIYNPGGLGPLMIPQVPPGKSFILMFEVDDVDAEYDRLKNLAVEFTALPTTQPWGCRAMSIADPDGNKIDFYSVKNLLSPDQRGGR